MSTASEEQVRMRKQRKGTRKAACGALIAAALMGLAMPAHAQFSEGYRFLEAVKKKEGDKVETLLGEPGSTVILSRDVSTGKGAIHIVTERRDIVWLRYLVAKGADVNMRDDKGVTALQLATSLGWVEGVDFLVERKADLDQSNDTGETPLISAVHRRDTQMVRILLRGGADPDRADNSGRSARDYARLDKAGQLLGVIETNAKPRSAAGKPGSSVYGPTF
jgi:ankyrin repeat protein